MSDPLSGGVIDESTSGPTPPNVDDRKTDIIAEQSENQRLDAIGGTESPPTPSQPQQILPPPQVAPQLPIIPSFDFSVSQSVTEETREIARQATIDVIKNVTINGKGPSIDGSSISFNVSQSAPASEIFSFQGIVEVRPQPVNANNITDVTVAPPARDPEPSTQAARPQTPQATETRGVDSVDFGTGGNEKFGQQAYTNLSDYTTFGKPPQETQERPSRLDDPDFGSSKPLYQSPPSRLDDPDFGTSDMDEKDDSYQKAQAAGRAKRESDPDFDRESDVRQKGERHSEFKERQEALKEERAERLKLAEEKATFAKRAKEGSIGETPSGMVPVALTRADGQRRILAYLASEFVGVVEGAESGERATNLPSDNSYYEAGGGDSTIHPFKIYSRVEGGVTEVKVESESFVYSGFGSFSTTAIAGLNSWTDAVQGYVIVVAEVSAGGTVTSQEILWGQASLGTRVTFANRVQTAYRFPIAYLYFVDTALQIRQLAFTDKTLVTVCVDGKGAVYPISA
jgi:hypothetical protein